MPSAELLPKRDVEQICSHLSPLLRKYISKITTTNDKYMLSGAFCLWLADWLAALKILDDEKIQIVIESTVHVISEFISKLTTAIDMKEQTLPTCKLGILDRNTVCLDGFDKFIMLDSGELIPTRQLMPIETITYNLTPIFLSYKEKYAGKNHV